MFGGVTSYVRAWTALVIGIALTAAACSEPTEAPSSEPTLPDAEPEHITAQRAEAVAAWTRNEKPETTAALVHAYYPEWKPRDADARPHDRYATLVPLGLDPETSLHVTTKSDGLEIKLYDYTFQLSSRDTRAGAIEHHDAAAFTSRRRMWMPAGAWQKRGDAWLATRLEEYEVRETGEGVWTSRVRIALPAGAWQVQQGEGFIDLGPVGKPAVLRLHEPEARDARGARRTGTLRVDDVFAVHDHLDATYEVDLTGLEGPVVVDPSVTIAFELDSFSSTTATLAPNGSVFLAGGYKTRWNNSNPSNPYAEFYSTDEVWTYRPDSADGNMVARMNTPDGSHGATWLQTAGVLLTINSYGGELASQAQMYPTYHTGYLARTPSYAQNGAPRVYGTSTLLANGNVLVAGGWFGFGALFMNGASQLYDKTTGTWTATGSMLQGRAQHTATLLPNGKVLVTGGFITDHTQGSTATAELYDPQTGTWSATGSMTTARAMHSATLLPNGMVLVVGGRAATWVGWWDKTLKTAELYNPATGTWTATSSMGWIRENHTATLLPNGKVAILGGLIEYATGGGTLDTHINGSVTNPVAEVYDPATATWTTIQSTAPFAGEQATTLLPSGQLLISGGNPKLGNVNDVSKALLAFDLQIGTWAPAANINQARSYIATTLLPDGTVLASGGVGTSGTPVTKSETYNPATNTWTSAGDLGTARECHTQTLLPNGKVLVAGGKTINGIGLASAELYNPVSRAWSATGSMTFSHVCHQATLLPTGKVMVTGDNAVEIYDPATGSWSTTGSLATTRNWHSATLLANGKVLVAGGYTSGTPTASAELWDPATGVWTSAGTLTTARARHTATVTGDGSVVFAGGIGASGAPIASIEAYTGSFAFVGNLASARSDHTATLLPGGEVVLTGGVGAGGSQLNSVESFDVQNKRGVALAPMASAHAIHTATLLANGKLLITSGITAGGAVTNAVELYDDTGGAPASKTPAISTLETPNAVEPGPLTVTGTGFFGRGGSGGTRRTSATDYPLVALQPLGGGQRVWLPQSSWTATTVNATVPSLPVGYYFLWVFVEGIPTSKIVALGEVPVATAQNVSVVEDTPKAITLSGTTTAGNITYLNLTQPAHGTLSGTMPNLTYTPAANYSGPDSFTFKVSNGYRVSLPATISLTVTPVNDAPVADAQSVPTAEDTPVSITLTGSDIDSTITYAIATPPAHGTLSGTAPNLTYTPAANYAGSDSFVFAVSDGALTTNATVTLTVTPVNDLPTANAQSVTTAEDTPVSFVLTGSDIESPLAYTVITPPTHGTLSGTAPNLMYTPAANFFGSDSLVFRVSDGTATSTATVTIAVTPVNDLPIANALAVSVAEDGTLAILLTGSDLESPITFALASTVAHGTLTGSAPNLTYTPAANYFGPEAFTFTVSDGALTSAPATVAITVTSVNDAPIANAQTRTVFETTPAVFVLTGSDLENSALTYAIATQPAHGALTGTPPNVTYTAVAGYSGADAFSFKVNDGGLDSAPATVALTVVNAPVATAQNITLVEDTPRAITLSATDADGGTLAYTIVTPPAHGTLAGTPPNVTYTPAANYYGPDSFTFTASDGTYASTAATVGLTITPSNDAPVAVSEAMWLWEDHVGTFTLSASDADGDPLTYTLLTQPARGTLSGTPPNLTYTPDPEFYGNLTFTFKVNDGSVDSAIATVSLYVQIVYDPPVATAQSFTVLEDTETTLRFQATTIEPGAYLFADIVSWPTTGSWVYWGNEPMEMIYYPPPEFQGTDTFEYVIRDVDGNTATPVMTATVTVVPVNDVPDADAQSITVTEDTPRTLTLTATDVESTNLTYAVSVPPAHGTLTGTPPNLTYTPAANYAGPDSFTFGADDGEATGTATITLTVTPVEDAPTAIAQTLVVAPNTPRSVVLTGSDPENRPLTYTVLTPPLHGTLTGTAPNLTYTPANGYAGEDAFTFRVRDGIFDSALATITLVVTANTQPVATAQSLTTAEDTAVAVVLAGTDAEGSTLAYAVVTPPAHGTLSGTAPNLTYTPGANYSGPDSFTFKVNDGTLDSAEATVALTVTPVNDPPSAIARTATPAEDVAVAVTLTGTDDEGAALAFTVVTPPAHGTLSGTAPNLTYTPAADYHGPDSFSFTVNDGTFDSAPATVSLTVTPVNDAPAAVAQDLMTAEDTPLAMTLGGTDIENAALTASIAVQPAHGTVTGSGQSFTYTPAANFAGADTFMFRVNDGGLDSAPVMVTLTVTPVNDAPTATAATITTDEDTAHAIELAATDVDGPALAFTVVTQPAHGTLSGTAPNLTYTPAANYHGSDTFTFRASDGTLDSANATITLSVTSVNDAPVALAQTKAAVPGEGTELTLTGTDVDEDSLTFALVDEPAVGTLTGTPPNLTYTAPIGHRGIETLTFTVSDGTLTSAPATVTLRVSNGPPVVAASASTLVPLEGEDVLFTATAEDPGGDTLTYTWDFGDGQTSTVLSPTHAYANEGTYTATLSVTDGFDTTTASLELVVANAAPVVVPFDVPAMGEEAKQLAFHAGATDEGTSDVLTFSWSFGDNTAAVTGADATHVYADNGSYTVTLTVFDGTTTVTETRQVEIRNLPPQIDEVEARAVDAHSLLELTLTATDIAGDADPITFSLVEGPGEVSADGAYTWTPTNADAGEHAIKVRATDDDGGAGDVVFLVSVVATDEGGGCCSTSSSPSGGSAALALLVAALLRRRRRT
ncbi:MAG: Ig-like domain-containing protein [Kofleriaceae bacterium]|nr:Ig-like domain-containing protein [Kofleriaceae bacterium]